jgi:hypothetical protein
MVCNYSMSSFGLDFRLELSFTSIIAVDDTPTLQTPTNDKHGNTEIFVSERSEVSYAYFYVFLILSLMSYPILVRHKGREK